MIKSYKFMVIALIIPVLALIFLAVSKKYRLEVGKELVFPIEGYDPRNLLSGHYLIYTVDYGIKEICKNTSYKQMSPAYVCLVPKKFIYGKTTDCKLFIKGVCNGPRFEAGVERYYIPESEAGRLEDLVRSKKASISLSVLPNGKAQIKDLLIDGRSWKKQ